MSLNTIGILGCGGHIGKYATEKLLRCRGIEKNFKKPKFLHRRYDG